MKKNMIYVFLAIVITLTLIISLNPLRKSKEKIREYILKLTPIYK